MKENKEGDKKQSSKTKKKMNSKKFVKRIKLQILLNVCVLSAITT